VLPSSANGDNPFFAPKRIPDQEGVGPFKLPWDPDVWVLGFWGFGAAQKNKKKNTSVAIICKQRQFFFFRAKKDYRLGKCRSVQTSVGPRCLGFGVLGFLMRTAPKKTKKKKRTSFLS
jgi:hypothetical protein